MRYSLRSTSRLHSGDLQSYLVMKFNWAVHPTTKPSLAVVDDVAYVSWNGTTEVHQRVIDTGESSDDDDDYWQPVINATKAGFEARIELSRNLGSYIRVAAVDVESRMIGASDTFKYEQVSGACNRANRQRTDRPMFRRRYLILCSSAVRIHGR